ncbi:MAG TPA: EAL domain-containing protein, partial [Rhodocyclaceae bacterium]|nr:EAL domain-containing protein [Rhodocyclaceae bacterium]
FSDISELMRHRRRLEVMATTDALTGLPNRALLTDRLKQAVAHADRLGNTLGVAFVDLDGFKAINDQEGHHFGDALLVEVAERFGRTIRLGDTAARLGGDEFVLLLNNVGSREMALGALERILEAVAAPHLVDGRQLAVSASIGVTFYPEDNADPDTLLRHADHAMYQAKSLGRARIHVFDPEYDRLFQSHHALVEELRRGMRLGELVLHYQPKVDLLTRQVTGMEALLRWNHPERGFLLPNQFIDELADDEVVGEIGDWVIGQVCRQMSCWQADGRRRFPVSVNLSPRHLIRHGFAESLRRTVVDCPGASFGSLEIEIIESDTLQDLGCLERVIRDCQSLGVRFSLDDFGTGFSSLSHLKNIPGDILKIDRSFVINMLAAEDDRAIVEGIIRLGHVFKREVVAEGIESEEHIQELCRLGCRQGQGFGIARPMPAEEVLPWIDERSARPTARA